MDTLEGHSTLLLLSTMAFVLFLAIQMKANVAAETEEFEELRPKSLLGQAEDISTGVGITDKHLYSYTYLTFDTDTMAHV